MDEIQPRVKAQVELGSLVGGVQAPTRSTGSPLLRSQPCAACWGWLLGGSALPPQARAAFGTGLHQFVWAEALFFLNWTSRDYEPRFANGSET